MAKVKVSYGKCTIYVQGMEMDCPLCGVHVSSGEHHECSSPEPKQLPRKFKKKLA